MEKRSYNPFTFTRQNIELITGNNSLSFTRQNIELITGNNSLIRRGEKDWWGIISKFRL